MYIENVQKGYNTKKKNSIDILFFFVQKNQ